MPNSSPSGFLLALAGHLRRTGVRGVLVLVPLAATYLILRVAFNALDGLLLPLFTKTLGITFPGVGLVALVALAYVLGLIASNVAGRWVIRGGQRALGFVPLVSFVYGSIRDLTEAFAGEREDGFKQVVLVEYPRAGAWAIGFLTGMTTAAAGERMAVVYIPSAPMPQTGWVAILPLAQVRSCGLTVPQAMQVVVSGGIAATSDIRMGPSLTETR
jgi:uncharacterized membrane protein